MMSGLKQYNFKSIIGIWQVYLARSFSQTWFLHLSKVYVTLNTSNYSSTTLIHSSTYIVKTNETLIIITKKLINTWCEHETGCEMKNTTFNRFTCQIKFQNSHKMLLWLLFHTMSAFVSGYYPTNEVTLTLPDIFFFLAPGFPVNVEIAKKLFVIKLGQLC